MAYVDLATRARILDALIPVIEKYEKETEQVLGVYVQIGDELYSWNGEKLVHAGKADNLLKEQ